MGQYSEMMKKANPPSGDGFPFGSFLMEHKLLELKKEKDNKGQYKDYWIWHLLIKAKRHPSAQGTEGVVVKLRRDFASEYGITDNTAIAAALAGKTFEEYQGLPDADIEAYIPNLADEKASAEKHRQMVLEATPDAKGYRRYHAYTIPNAPAQPFVFDPAAVPARPAKDEASAAAEAGKGSAAKPPTSTI